MPDMVRKNGYFATPDKFILPGSVVPGEWLGYPEGKLRFEFVPNKPNFDAWRPTYEPIHMLWSVLRSRKADGSPIRETRLINPK